MPSKFIEQVQIKMSDPLKRKYRPVAIPDLEVKEEYTRTKSMGSSYSDIEYRIGVNWGKIVYAQPKELRVLKDIIVRELHHDIYGEFIRDLLRTHCHIATRDYEKAKELIEKIIKDVSI